MANFDELVSITNDYNQTLAHFAVMFEYPKLLRRLVEWDIAVTTADVNGLTTLHCAYGGGEKAVIRLLLNAGAPENLLDALGRTSAHLMPNEFEASEVALDALGRAPSHLMPDGFESGRNHDADMSSDGQFELEEKLDILALRPSSSSGHGVSDLDDENSVNNDERVCQVIHSGHMDRTRSHRRRKLLQLLAIDQFTNFSRRPKAFQASRPSQRL